MAKSVVMVDGAEREITYPDVFHEDVVGGVPRLLIGARGSPTELAGALAGRLRPPWFVLYVLTVPRTDDAPGRYQSPLIDDHEVLAVFLAAFREFFDGDARHHVWIGTRDGSGLIVIDRHNHLAAYGPLEEIRRDLRARGFGVGPVRVPSPHAHHYHARFDDAQRAVLARWPWKRYPLADSDDG